MEVEIDAGKRPGTATSDAARIKQLEHENRELERANEILPAASSLASYDDKAHCLIVKLPRNRVRELVDSGDGDPFAPAGRVFREWVAVATIDRDLWSAVLAEAVEFAGESLSEPG